MGEGSGQGCNRRGQPTQAGAMPSYKSPSTQLEPVKGCAHPAESTALGGQPAPCGGWGASDLVCAYVCACASLCKRACVSLCTCLYVPVCACLLSICMCVGVSTGAWGSLCVQHACISCVFVMKCVCMYLFVPRGAMCPPVCRY